MGSDSGNFRIGIPATCVALYCRDASNTLLWEELPWEFASNCVYSSGLGSKLLPVARPLVSLTLPALPGAYVRRAHAAPPWPGQRVEVLIKVCVIHQVARPYPEPLHLAYMRPTFPTAVKKWAYKARKNSPFVLSPWLCLAYV